jgi:hypothetical protein
MGVIKFKTIVDFKNNLLYREQGHPESPWGLYELDDIYNITRASIGTPAGVKDYTC